MSLRVVLITAPDADLAERLARGIVEARLAACVNVVPGVTSHYRWRGRLQKDAEVLLIAKTTSAKVKRLVQYVKDNHSYELPETIALPIVAGSADYLKWVREGSK
jgi:periplasmic divalent cation tolerance protein